MERLEFPPLGTRFPIYDVLILISISLLPFVYKSGGIVYVSGLFSFMMLFWALMLFKIIKDYKRTYHKGKGNNC